MSFLPSPRQQLILWRLAVAGGGEWNPHIKPTLDRADRLRLLEAGLIEAEKRQPPGGRSKPLYIWLTEKGWAWLSEHVDGLLPNRPTNLETLQRLLARLKTFLETNHLALAEFLNPLPPPAANGWSAGDLQPRIESVYYRLSGGRPNVRVRLADLRSALADVPRQQLDEGLLTLATQGRAALYRLDNPHEIQPQDRDAVLRTPSGEERHILYLGGPAS